MWAQATHNKSNTSTLGNCSINQCIKVIKNSQEYPRVAWQHFTELMSSQPSGDVSQVKGEDIQDCFHILEI